MPLRDKDVTNDEEWVVNRERRWTVFPGTRFIYVQKMKHVTAKIECEFVPLNYVWFLFLSWSNHTIHHEMCSKQGLGPAAATRLQTSITVLTVKFWAHGSDQQLTEGAETLPVVVPTVHTTSPKIARYHNALVEWCLVCTFTLGAGLLSMHNVPNLIT